MLIKINTYAVEQAEVSHILQSKISQNQFLLMTLSLQNLKFMSGEIRSKNLLQITTVEIFVTVKDFIKRCQKTHLKYKFYLNPKVPKQEKVIWFLTTILPQTLQIDSFAADSAKIKKNQMFKGKTKI